MFSYLKLIYYLLRPNVIFVNRGSAGIGDNLLLDVVLPELRRKRPRAKLVIETRYPDLFRHNPDVTWATDKHLKTTRRHLRPRYRVNPDTTVSIYEQLTGAVGEPARTPPRLFLTDAERASARRRYPGDYVAVCPTGKTTFASNRKEWGVDTFQAVRDGLPEDAFVQVGTPTDPLLANVVDARGLPLRESAAVLANARLFLGLEGGLMHLAKAVGTRAAIVFGGALRPEVYAYEDHLVFSNPVECSPCLDSNRPNDPCGTMICMKGISPRTVIARLRADLGRKE